MNADRSALFPRLAAYVAAVHDAQEPISDQRIADLRQLARFIRESQNTRTAAKVVFICTHNSRRSQLAQVWAQVAAHVFERPHVAAFSGGTEVTAFNSRAVTALLRAGFRIEITTLGKNPLYAVRYSSEAEPIVCFSKVYDQPPIPSADFCAVMTCSAADSACPVVLGASERFNIRYDDPKVFDGTDRETSMYDERCRQIAREMLYSFSPVTAG